MFFLVVGCKGYPRLSQSRSLLIFCSGLEVSLGARSLASSRFALTELATCVEIYRDILLGQTQTSAVSKHAEDQQ